MQSHTVGIDLLPTGLSSSSLCAIHSSMNVVDRMPHRDSMAATAADPKLRHSRRPRTHATSVLHRSMPSRRLNLDATHRMACTMRRASSAAVQSRGDTGVVAQVTRLDPDHTPCPHRLTSTAEPRC